MCWPDFRNHTIQLKSSHIRLAMVSTLNNLSRQRQQVREESKRLTRLLKQSRQQLAVVTRREELAKDRRRRIGLRIMATASDALTFLKSYLKSELSTVSELVADSEYKEISKEFLALSPAEVNALTDHMDATRCVICRRPSTGPSNRSCMHGHPSRTLQKG